MKFMRTQPKPIVKHIKAQIQMLDDDEQAAKQASVRRAKQKAQLLEILDAVELEDMTPKEATLFKLHRDARKKEAEKKQA